MNVKLFERVKRVVHEQLKIHEDQILESSNFVDDLRVDSLECVELTMSIESEFNIDISEEEAERLTTVHSLLEFLEHVKHIKE